MNFIRRVGSRLLGRGPSAAGAESASKSSAGKGLSYIGCTVLRETAAAVPVNEIRTKPIQELVKTMVRLMKENEGCGISAPQVGVGKRVFVCMWKSEWSKSMSPRTLAETGTVAFPLKVCINPELVAIGGRTTRLQEGCLSVPSYTAVVERFHKVKLTAYDENARKFEWIVSGYPARILQHEYDHMNGVVCVDRMLPRSMIHIESDMEIPSDYKRVSPPRLSVIPDEPAMIARGRKSS